MNFRIFGPYQIPTEEGEHSDFIEREDIRAFWSRNVSPNELTNACGVYIFCVDGVKGKRKGIGRDLVWYVGKAEKLSFKRECFNGKNRNLYNQIINANYKGHGTPKMFFVVRHNKSGEFSLTAEKEEEFLGIRFLEKIFIQYAMETNGKLGNIAGRRRYSNTYVEGFLNDTKANIRSAGVQSFRNAIGIEKQFVVADNSDYFGDTYRVLGPYDVPIRRGGIPKRIDHGGFQVLFDSEVRFPIRDSAGVYVIATQNGEKMRPIYIGNLNGSLNRKDTGKREFRTFANFRIDERKMSREVRSTRGRYKIFFLPRVTSNGNPAKPNPNSERFLLELLMLQAMMVYPGVRSSDPTAHFLNGLYLEGWLNKGTGDNRRNSVRQLKRLLQI